MASLFVAAGSLPDCFDTLFDCYLIFAGRNLLQFRCFNHSVCVFWIVALAQRSEHAAMNRIRSTLDHCRNAMVIAG